MAVNILPAVARATATLILLLPKPQHPHYLNAISCSVLSLLHLAEGHGMHTAARYSSLAAVATITYGNPIYRPFVFILFAERHLLLWFSFSLSRVFQTGGRRRCCICWAPESSFPVLQSQHLALRMYHYTQIFLPDMSPHKPSLPHPSAGCLLLVLEGFGSEGK